MTAPDYSVMIPACNAAATLDRCLEALSAQTVDRSRYEILVVDDGSTDATVERVRAWPTARLLTQAHAGPAAARNLGIAHAAGQIVLFTDADCAPAPDWVARLTAPFEAAGAGDPAAPARPVAGAKGTYLTHQRELVARFVQLEYEEKYARLARHAEIDFVDTYSAAYRRDVLLDNGGFDTAFPEASVEDQELSFRLARKGYRLVFVPDAHVYHLGHARTIAEYCRKKFRIGYWKVLVHRRHPGKLLRDSHTPQTLRVQIGLVWIGALCTLGSFFWASLSWAAALLALFFLLTTLPFVTKAWARDRQVAAASPCLLLVRSLALGAGFAAGLVAHALGRNRIDRAPT